MRTIEVYSFPYNKNSEVFTRLFIDKQEINNPDNRLTQFVVKKPMSKWLKSYKRKLFVWKGFLYELAVELNASDYTIVFNGTEDDFQIFSEEIMLQKMQLENDGRKINIELVFRERFECRRAVKVMTDAYGALIHKEYADSNFTVSDKIKFAKDKLNFVPCLVETFGSMSEDFGEKLDKSELIIINPKCPKLIAAIFGSDSTEDICFRTSELLKNKKFKQVLVIIPESADIGNSKDAAKAIARDCGVHENMVHFLYYADNPIKTLEDGIYFYYMPDIITESIRDFYELSRAFDDYETDSYIMEANRQIDELFD